MDYKEIRKLALLMKETGLTSLMYGNGDETVKLTRPLEAKPSADIPMKAPPVEQRSAEEPPAGTFTVKSPMVGVFYSAPGANEEPYVAVGSTVHAGDVLCIIEAMKTMNELTAERDGTITEICVENKDVVEFGQPLFRINTP